MGREVHVVVLILLSIFEVWMCYQVLYRTVLDKKYLRTWQKVLIWMNILGVGTLLGVNRNILYFSHTVFYISILISFIFVFSIENKDKLIKLELVALYNTSLALLDFFWAFLSMQFVGDDFYSSIYKFSKENIQIVLFLMSRGALMVLLIKWEEKTQEVKNHKKGLFILEIILLILLREYQITLANMALGIKTMRGLAVAISMLILLFVIMGSFVMIYHFNMLKKENEMLTVRDELSKKHLEEMEKLMEKHHILIHDMKKHLLILKEYSKLQEWDLLVQYLNELSNEINQSKKQVWTQNRILNIVLEQEITKAEKLGIEFQIEEIAIGKLPLNDTEICALFGNLLDNAIEACSKIKSKKKWIEIKLWRKSQMLYIVISNSIAMRPEERHGKWISDKVDKASHGYGLKSVQKIVKKYNGELEFQVTASEFNIKIILFL